MAHNNRPMRRSALIGPWGVGAIVPFPNDESLMIAGLDMWRYNDATPFIKKMSVFCADWVFRNCAGPLIFGRIMPTRKTVS